MLRYIQRMLPYPHTGIANIIYNICDTKNMREHVKYNPGLDQFEVSISELYENKGCFTDVIYGDALKSLSNSPSYDNVIEGTIIHYHVDIDGNFCFKIE